jgi:Protein of unknown function (DUF3300)
MTLSTRSMRAKTRGEEGFSTRPRAANFSGLRFGQQTLAFMLAIGLLFTTLPQNLAAQVAQAPAQAADASQTAAPAYTTQTADQLDQLVAPIALYPDSLVAQVLAASTFPAEIVEADRWVQANPDLKGDDLAKAVDQQTWDPSVKALTAFPSVLANMDKNLSWASSLGDAYYNQQSDVMNAIQVMRQKAQQTGNLKDTPQQTVQTQGSDIVIQPAQPDVVYVPAYDPWTVYGYPVAPWPYWYNYPGIWFGGPYLSFGVGFGIGFYGGYGWGWNSWGANWGGRTIVYNHNTYISHTNTFYNRNNYYRNGGARGVANNVNRGGADRDGNIGGRGGVEHNDGTHGENNANHGGNVGERGAEQNRSGERAFNGDSRQARGFGDQQGQSGTRSSGFSGYSHGGNTRDFSSRGQSSFGGGGGGFRGGGGGGGGRRR